MVNNSPIAVAGTVKNHFHHFSQRRCIKIEITNPAFAHEMIAIKIQTNSLLSCDAIRPIVNEITVNMQSTINTYRLIRTEWRLAYIFCLQCKKPNDTIYHFTVHLHRDSLDDDSCLLYRCSYCRNRSTNDKGEIVLLRQFVPANSAEVKRSGKMPNGFLTEAQSIWLESVLLLPRTGVADRLDAEHLPR